MPMVGVVISARNVSLVGRGRIIGFHDIRGTRGIGSGFPPVFVSLGLNYDFLRVVLGSCGREIIPG